MVTTSARTTSFAWTMTMGGWRQMPCPQIDRASWHRRQTAASHRPFPYQGCFSDPRHVLLPRSAGLPVCPRVTVTVPDRPPIGHVAG
jgi:hypothetical protein